jgi:protein-tyrosine phosphatase
MKLDLIPLPYAGRLFRSPMPFSSLDTNNAWEGYQQENVKVVVMLASREECIRVTGFDLMELYRSTGMEVIYLPIPDFGVIEPPDIREGINRILAQLQAGKNVAAHCHAGRGRTGMLLACVLRAAEGIDGEEAIRRVRAVIPGAVETPQQEQVVINFEPIRGDGHVNP